MTTIYKIEFDIEAISRALKITPEQAKGIFRDGRVSWKFAECWSADYVGVTMHSGNTHISTDAFVRLKDGEHIEFAIRTLTKRGIKFQDSRYYGTGRWCDKNRLRQSVRSSDRWIVCDVTEFPVVSIYKVKSATILAWVDLGELTPTGLSYDKFIRLFFRDCRPTVQQLELPT